MSIKCHSYARPLQTQPLYFSTNRILEFFYPIARRSLERCFFCSEIKGVSYGCASMLSSNEFSMWERAYDDEGVVGLRDRRLKARRLGAPITQPIFGRAFG